MLLFLREKKRVVTHSTALHTLFIPEDRRSLDLALAGIDLDVLRIHASKGRGLVVCQSIHGCLGNVEAGCSVVDCENIDGVAPVCDGVAGAALKVVLSVLV